MVDQIGHKTIYSNRFYIKDARWAIGQCIAKSCGFNSARGQGITLGGEVDLEAHSPVHGQT